MDTLDIAAGVIGGRVASNAKGPLHLLRVRLYAIVGQWKFEELLATVIADIDAAVGSNRSAVGPGAKFSARVAKVDRWIGPITTVGSEAIAE